MLRMRSAAFRLSLMCLSLFAAEALAWQPQTGGGPATKRITAPQIVSANNIATDIVLLNTASTVCNTSLLYHIGAGNEPANPLLTNGQEFPNPLAVQIPAGGSRLLNVRSSTPDLFTGAATLQILDPACFGSINLQTQYRILSPSNELGELFSYPSPAPVPLNSCASVPVNYDPDPTDGQSNVLGIAEVSLEQLDGVTRTMQLFDSQGDLIDTRPAENINGQHQATQLNLLFPDQGAFSGSLEVCYNGQRLPTLQNETIDVLFINVVQSGTVVQFDSNDHSVTRPGCRPDGRTLCLNDGRFRVTAENLPGGQNPVPGNVADFQRDDVGGFFFFSPDNTEMLVKVLDGCAANDHFWVFAGSLTNVEYEITVTDTATGLSKVFTNPLGQPAAPIVDTQAFASCP